MNKKFFMLPFAGLMLYTFGIFFLINSRLGIYFSPGGSTLSTPSIRIVSATVLALIVVVLFFTLKRKKEDEKQR